MKKAVKISSALFASSMILGACSSADGTKMIQTKAKIGDFATFGYDYELTRHVPFELIKRNNVKNLKLIWSKKIDGYNNESFPVIMDGVAYISSSNSEVFAIDALSGKELWKWTPPKELSGIHAVNHGVSIGGGKVYLLTADNSIVSIDQKTGKTIKTTKIGNTESNVPIYFDGKLFIGGEFITVLDAESLKPEWTTQQAGGDVSMPPSVDKESGIAYFSVGSSKNIPADSVIALDIKTGKLIWRQQQPIDGLTDSGIVDSPTIIKATINGKVQKAVSVGTNKGEWFLYDARTGNPIYKNVVFESVDPPKPDTEGIIGGQNGAPGTFDPEDNLTLIPSMEQPVIYRSAESKQEVQMQKDIQASGKITSVYLNNGQIKYSIKTDGPVEGGLTSTKTGITFYGEQSGKVKAMESASGKELWSYQTSGLSFSSAPSIFEKDGNEYVLFVSGGNIPQIFVFGLETKNASK